jgi:hypothetical protein
MMITLMTIALLILLWDSGGSEQVEDPTAPSTLRFENTYNSEGHLIPLPGEWQLINEAGVAGRQDDVELEEGHQRGYLELIDAQGEQIRVRPADAVAWTELDRILSSATEAEYATTLMGGVEMRLRFTSSSTLGGRLEECADRGGEGWLLEPAG